ncbi:hypothetical protein NSPZN2_160021 [Nitrospira defluvii]|uniref:Uncharacterized protein n=1 Tax=Nitrospira defluvii TaxID=330214 RepID=A0ABM8RB63_9BACT|nr:hypothetical protein NSPZN2_160021 [Nitrospira defluvii]
MQTDKPTTYGGEHGTWGEVEWGRTEQANALGGAAELSGNTRTAG